MDLENQLKNAISTKLEEGLVEKLIAENLEKAINNALEKLMGTYGDITQLIQSKIKEVMIKQLESYDYSQYVVKLDFVLTEILRNTTLDNQKILENFEDLMSGPMPKLVELSEIFEQYTNHVSSNVDTDGLKVQYDDEPSYEPVFVTMEVEYEKKRDWSDFKHAKVVFECEDDEELNMEIQLVNFNNQGWTINVNDRATISSLKYMSGFEIYLLKLYQNKVKIEIDENYLDDEVTPKEKPETD